MRAARNELGRGERVLPGLWRLRLPLTIPGVPHGNAWALATGQELVLVDCGTGRTVPELERALHQVGLALERVSLIVATHAHVDHCGGAAAVAQRTGADLWLHPRHEHYNTDRAAEAKRIRGLARKAGVPEPLLDAVSAADDGADFGPLVVARDLVPGVVLSTDLGDWHVHETPGHAPSHVVLHQPETRLLLSGDHVLGRIALYFDFDWTPDPVGEYLASLELVDGLDARLGLAGHGRPFTDVPGHILATRELIDQRCAAIEAALRTSGEASAFELLQPVYGQARTPAAAARQLVELGAFLHHLATIGRVQRAGSDPERFSV